MVRFFNTFFIEHLWWLLLYCAFFFTLPIFQYYRECMIWLKLTHSFHHWFITSQLPHGSDTFDDKINHMTLICILKTVFKSHKFLKIPFLNPYSLLYLLIPILISDICADVMFRIGHFILECVDFRWLALEWLICRF